MSDAAKHAGAKPRLSLFSSKQAVIRLKSDDQLDQQTSNVVAQDSESQVGTDRNPEANQQQTPESKQTAGSDKETRLNDGAQNDPNKMNISKEDLIRLLSVLKSELHSKEIALAAIKCEQLKRLINPIEISRSSLANTYMKLQDRFKQKDRNNNTKEKLTSQSSSEQKQQQSSLDQDGNHSGNNDIEEENLNILIALLELLDQHPLLALPRDSIYCLDYNCNELSTKNYLSLKIQHLDNLIDQHRRFRYYMTNRLQRSEQRLSEITTQLEFERGLKLEKGKTIYGPTGETVYLKRIEEIRECLEKEKRDKQVIVTTLLNELLDEKERVSSLTEQLAKSTLLQSNEQSNEKEKLLKMQSELDSLNLQLKKQASTFVREREETLTKMTTLKNENSSLRSKLEQFEKRPMTSPKPTSHQETKETGRLASPSSPGKANCSKSINSSSRSQANMNSPTATMRATKPSPTSRLPNSPNSTHTITAQGATQQQAARQSATNTRSGGSIALSKSPAAGEPKTQALFKSASVQSTYQQVRSQRISANNNQLARSTSTTQATPSKPQVPAKPAQLLDQQRGPQ